LPETVAFGSQSFYLREISCVKSFLNPLQGPVDKKMEDRKNDKKQYNYAYQNLIKIDFKLQRNKEEDQEKNSANQQQTGKDTNMYPCMHQAPSLQLYTHSTIYGRLFQVGIPGNGDVSEGY